MKKGVYETRYLNPKKPQPFLLESYPFSCMKKVFIIAQARNQPINSKKALFIWGGTGLGANPRGTGLVIFLLSDRSCSGLGLH